MSIRKKRSEIVAAVAVFFVVGVIVGTRGWTPSTLPTPSNDRPLFVYPFASDTLYQRVNDSIDVERTGARAVIVAHHLLVADKIASEVAMLGTGKEKTVVILSPNHFSLGRSAMQTAVGEWRTPDGALESDDTIVESLRERVDGLTPEPETFTQEHGVSAIAPFVKRWFPQAKVVALAIHDKATIAQTDALAVAIVEVVPDAIVIASIDMSHNLPQHIQTYHDEVTLRSIENGQCHGECRLEVDANAVLDTLFEINRLRGTQQFTLTHHGSSLAMGATDDWRENTSHILGYFLEGKPVDNPFVSLHFVGDVMLDRGVREKIDAFGVDYPWANMSRYLSGSDYRIANLEGTISEKESLYTHDPPFIFTFAPTFVEAIKPFIDVVSLANNHADDYGAAGEVETRERLDVLGIPWFGGATSSENVYRIDEQGIAVSLIGYHQFGASLEELEDTIAHEANAGRFVIVFPHWGEEYIQAPQAGQRDRARRMIAAGADLIIGAHPHVVQGIETISPTSGEAGLWRAGDGVPVVYSLGNFIFDQEFGETTKGLTVGVILDRKAVTLYLSPISTIDAQPTPLSDEEAQELFSSLSIQNSTLTFFYGEL